MCKYYRAAASAAAAAAAAAAVAAVLSSYPSVLVAVHLCRQALRVWWWEEGDAVVGTPRDFSPRWWQSSNSWVRAPQRVTATVRVGTRPEFLLKTKEERERGRENGNFPGIPTR